MLTSLVTPPAPTRISPLDQLRELVGELHGHAAAERMTDHGDVIDVEHAEQVRACRWLRGHRIVGARLVGLAVAKQIRAMTVNRCASFD